MTIGLLPDAGARRLPDAGAGRLPDAVKPGIQCVRTPWIRGFMAFRRPGHARIVMLMMPA
jgi:hypothetical protein